MNTLAHRLSPGIRTALGFGASAALLLLAAGTAYADSFDGTYDVDTPLGSIGQWTITSCGPVCSEISLGGGGNKKADPDMATGAVADGNVRVTNGQAASQRPRRVRARTRHPCNKRSLTPSISRQ